MTKKTIVLTMLFLAIFSISRSDQILYDITLLGDLPGGKPAGVTRANCISNNGLIAGSGYPKSQGPVAVLYDASGNGNNINLDPYGRYSFARGINIHGYAVGYGRIGGGSLKAVLFDTSGNGNNTVLGSVSDTYGIRAYAINDHNLIVGGSHNGRYRKAWIFDITGNQNNIYLGQGEAIAVSNSGIIVGSGYFGYSSASPAVFDPTGNGNNISLGGIGAAYSVNDYGEVVGYIKTNGTLRAKLFFASRERDSITIGNDNSVAESINNKGQIVGTEQGHATLFDKKGSSNNINLNDVIDPMSDWILKDAFAINEDGWIVGRGTLNGIDAKFLLTPTQKPLIVPFDIKPQTCPNPLNVNSNGVLPVAILGSDIFDVNDIDHNSILLEGISPIRMSLEDVATPNADPNECACNSVGPDGYIDLSLKFDTQEIVATLGEVSDGDMWMLHLTGTLQDGTEIEGTDCIEIIKKGKE